MRRGRRFQCVCCPVRVRSRSLENSSNNPENYNGSYMQRKHADCVFQRKRDELKHPQCNVTFLYSSIPMGLKCSILVFSYYSFIPHYAQQSLYEVQNIYTQVSDVKTILFTLHVSGKIPIIRSHHESYAYHCQNVEFEFEFIYIP